MRGRSPCAATQPPVFRANSVGFLSSCSGGDDRADELTIRVRQAGFWWCRISHRTVAVAGGSVMSCCCLLFAALRSEVCRTRLRRLPTRPLGNDASLLQMLANFAVMDWGPAFPPRFVEIPLLL